MGTVVASATMSLDGFIAKHDNSVGHLFDWFQAGAIEVPAPAGDIVFRMTEQSAAHWSGWTSRLGAVVCGRTLFDFTDGWGGQHTMGVPVVVVTHEEPAAWIAAYPDAPFTFVTSGVRDAVAHAQRLAGDDVVAVAAGTVAGQCLELGLLDEVAIDLAPVVLGGGRPFFGDTALADVPLGDPTVCIAADRVTHFVFPVTR